MHVKKIKVWKGGRRRKSPEVRDYGTPEAQLRRIILSGGKPEAAERIAGRVTRWIDRDDHAKSRDTTLTSSPLDVLLARGQIAGDDHAAAAYWVGLRKRLFGKASPGAIDLLAVNGGCPDELEDDHLARVERKYRAACSALQAAGPLVFQITESILVHQEWPSWVTDRARSADWRMRLLRLGIKTLGAWARKESPKQRSKTYPS